MAVVTITTENFAQEVLHSDKPVLLDFWASWCGPCRMLSPIVDEVAEERTDVKVGKVNVDEQPDLAAQFGVMSIPTLLVFEQGKLVRQAVGARPKAGVLELLGKDVLTEPSAGDCGWLFLCSPAVNSCGPAVKHFRLSVQTHRKNVRWSCKHCHFPALQLYQDKVK